MKLNMRIFTDEVEKWKITAISEMFQVGDRTWGRIRLAAALIVSIVFMFLMCLFFEGDSTGSAVQKWVEVIPMLDFVPRPVLQFTAVIFTGDCRRYLLAPLAAFTAALFLGARYVQDIYKLDTFRLGLNYLLASIFAINYPALLISEGKKQIHKNEMNLLDAVGGPGFVIVRPGNVVLFERLKSPSNVRAAGAHFISRLETIKDIANLDDQHGYIDKVSATTKDGIEIEVLDIHFRYRLRAGFRPGDYTERTPDNPYPYSIQAVRHMAYHRVVNEDGLIDWHSTVSGVIKGVITDYIYQHQFDYLTTPRVEGFNPRTEIRTQFNSKTVRERLRHLGAELLWLDIGHFNFPEKAVGEQRLDSWQAKWIGNATVERAYGDAQRLAYQEMGRAEAQAEMLLSIVHALEDARVSGSPEQNLQKIVLARTAHILDAMGESGPMLSGEMLTKPMGTTK